MRGPRVSGQLWRLMVDLRTKCSIDQSSPNSKESAPATADSVAITERELIKQRYEYVLLWQEQANGDAHLPKWTWLSPVPEPNGLVRWPASRCDNKPNQQQHHNQRDLHHQTISRRPYMPG